MIAAFLAWLAAQFAKKGLQVFFILTQFTIFVLYIAIFAVTVSAFLYAYTWAYNQIIGIFTLLGNLNGGGLMACAMHGLECTGIKSAYENGINILYVGLTYKYGFMAKNFILHSITRISNELAKLGYLIGQW